MKAIIGVVILAVLAFSSQAIGQDNKTSSSIVGTWQLVSGTYTTVGNTIKRDSSAFASYKVITNNWYMVTIFNKQDGLLLGSAAGTVTFNGKQMTHTAQYASVNGRVGVTATFDVDVKGRILHQKGLLVGTDLDEEWIRIN